MENIIKKFDDEQALTPQDIIEIKRAYKQLTKEISTDKHILYNSDIYTSIETCSSCLRIAINTIRYALTKKEIF